MKRTTLSGPRIAEILTHVIGWGIVCGFPYLMMTKSGLNITWADYLRHGSIFPLSCLVIFYANYIYLIPKYLFNGHVKRYLLLNILLIGLIATGIHFWQDYLAYGYEKGQIANMQAMPKPPGPPRPPKWVSLMRDTFSMVLTVSLSAAIKMSGRWKEMESARQEAEKSRTEAELKNLRNQLNPHFLLNTLNNIYALIAFDTNKAQTAVQELSRLLRHVLYDNQQNFVPLEKEMGFIRNYIELMRIRLSSNVKVETQFDIHPGSRTEIAPLIFISLIENAFKHGISPTEPSFIHIRFSESEDDICCHITNSYHPKNQTDKSGSGIGLEQVQKRLELTYPGHYDWQHGISENGKEYKSLLIIHKKPAP